MGEKQKNKYSVVLCIFLFSVLIRTVLSICYYEYYEFWDELLHLKLANSLFENGTMSFRGIAREKSDFLYYLFLAPTFLAKNSIWTKYFIQVINAVMMSSAIFPLYFLANKLLNKQRDKYIVCLMCACMPELSYAGSVLQENLFFPLVILYFAILYQCENETEKKRGNLANVFLGFIGALLCTTKDVGYVVVFASVLARFITFFRVKEKKQYLLSAISHLGIFAVCKAFFLYIAKHCLVSQNIQLTAMTRIPNSANETSTLMNNLSNNQLLMLSAVGSYIVFFILVSGVFPTLLLLSGANSPQEKKSMNPSVLLSVLGIIIAVCLTDYYSVGILRIHYRYLFYFMPLIYLLFMVKVEHSNINASSYFIVAETVSILILFTKFIPVDYKCDYDSVSGWFLQLFSSQPALLCFKTVIIICITGLYVLIKKEKTKVLQTVGYLVCLIVTLANVYCNVRQYVQIYNYKQMFALAVADMKSLNQYIDSEEELVLFVGEYNVSMAVAECYYEGDYLYTIIDNFEERIAANEKIQVMQVSKWYELENMEDIDYLISRCPLEVPGYQYIDIGMGLYQFYERVE